MCSKKSKSFPTEIDSILERVRSIDPIVYGKTRNFIDGDVTYLSPYISRGVISTKFVLNEVLHRGFQVPAIEKFIQELAWRDYWQQVWKAKGSLIDQDLKQAQSEVSNTLMPKAILKGATSIEAIDESILELYETGYMHNHVRMYVGSIACNIAESHWKIPAQWMYYHLLDGDWASNALSWQWVAGANSSKKYYANQENINKYCYTNQKNTFLDIEYDQFEGLAIPNELSELTTPKLKTVLPATGKLSIDSSLPTFIYNYYNLDPFWKQEISGNRILLLEPSHFEAYPIGDKSVAFMMDLAKNIPKLQVYFGEFADLISENNLASIYYKEHPLSMHYKGIEEARDWMFKTEGYYPSFFAFWKKCKKELNY